ncbi:MAG TPA: type II toxin-antitoxin system HicB family antitoxin [Alphaproteobacteria bacterium]|nr:type II toxin-antitoxin system HicB family antitoxin [Alphaproteobacteria bacterium]
MDEDHGRLGAWFPDAPGCTALGETENELIENATDALAEWAADVLADGRTLPPPRSYVELQKSGEYRPGQDGMIAHIPLLLETGRLARANISLDAGLLADIDEAAARRGVTRSAFLAAAAREKIKAGA